MSKQQKIMAIVGVIALFLGLVYYTKGALTDKYKFDPRKYWEQAFDEDYDRIDGKLDIKVSDTDYNIWMHFKYPHECKMKHESEFKQEWIGAAQAWFTSHLPAEITAGLADINHIKFKSRQDNQTTLVTNEWIIYNPRTDEHYYRTWGTSR